MSPNPGWLQRRWAELRQPVERGKLLRSTYFSLRLVMAAFSLLLPPSLLLAARLSARIDMQPSISAFYHTCARDFFVGMIVSIAVCLIAYHGYTRLENHALTLAGLFLLGVVYAPTDADVTIEPCADSQSSPAVVTTKMPESELAHETTKLEERSLVGTIHLVCALLFFLSIALACFYGGCSDVCDARIARLYPWIARLMLIVVVGAPPIWWLLQPNPGKFVFWVETVAIWIFGAYWILKTVELRRVDRRAAGQPPQVDSIASA